MLKINFISYRLKRIAMLRGQKIVMSKKITLYDDSFMLNAIQFHLYVLV